MKSADTSKNGNGKQAPTANKKKENARDIDRRTFFSKPSDGRAVNINLPVEGRAFKLFIMSTIRNKVQLIGNVGNDPQITQLENGKKVSRFSLATNESYRTAKGEKVERTDWHNVVVWGRPVEVIERYVTKGKQIAIEGKLTSRSYIDKDGNERYITEVIANDFVLLGAKA